MDHRMRTKQNAIDGAKQKAIANHNADNVDGGKKKDARGIFPGC